MAWRVNWLGTWRPDSLAGKGPLSITLSNQFRMALFVWGFLTLFILTTMARDEFLINSMLWQYGPIFA